MSCEYYKNNTTILIENIDIRTASLLNRVVALILVEFLDFSHYFEKTTLLFSIFS